LQQALRELVNLLLENPEISKKDLNHHKFQVSRKYKLKKIPSNSEILKVLSSEERKVLTPVLRRKITRALSGIIVVAVMTKPFECPHGKCVYCPGGPKQGTPQSYTGHEPAAMRGSQNDFDPYKQVKSRIQQLKAIGHPVDKIELIIMGGTFPAAPRKYQKYFVKGCLDALQNSISKSLCEAKLLAEYKGINNVGITVETRPDYLGREDINEILNLGVTRVEIGVQNIYDDIYQLVERGHEVEQVINGTKNLKDSALKICYHMMPGLPGSNSKRDLEGFKKIFTDSYFMPDMIKIYPTLVVKGTKLYEFWKKGIYEPLSTDEAIKLVSKIKQIVPPWIRIMRVQRDIPRHQIVAGVDKSNLRQLVKENLSKNGQKCKCIRCKEVGYRILEGIYPEDIKIVYRKYRASEGFEVFISAEDVEKDILVGFIRLRIPSDEVFRKEITKKTGLIRELHVYGKMLPVGMKDIKEKGTWQHQGWGETLMSKAEKVAIEDYNLKRMLVMSALGTKKYYAKLGYKKDGIYVSKDLS
jgi:elongator complex protein 3